MRAAVLSFALVVLAVMASLVAFDDPWRTPDQQAAELFAAGRYAEAAERFEDPVWRALALYRSKDFEAAADAWSGQTGPEAAYDRGTALVFLGRYEEAVAAFDAALEARPDWREAAENRAVAQARIRTTTALGEATALGADDVVFSNEPNQQPGGDQVEVTGESAADDASLRALWLRSVETKPADFLRAKFASQRAAEGGR